MSFFLPDFFIVSSQVIRNLVFFGRAPVPKNLEFSASFDIHDVPLAFYVRPVHVGRDFRPWDVMTKVRYFFMVQTYNLRTVDR